MNNYIISEKGATIIFPSDAMIYTYDTQFFSQTIEMSKIS